MEEACAAGIKEEFFYQAFHAVHAKNLERRVNLAVGFDYLYRGYHGPYAPCQRSLEVDVVKYPLQTAAMGAGVSVIPCAIAADVGAAALPIFLTCVGGGAALALPFVAYGAASIVGNLMSKRYREQGLTGYKLDWTSEKMVRRVAGKMVKKRKRINYDKIIKKAVRMQQNAYRGMEERARLADERMEKIAVLRECVVPQLLEADISLDELNKSYAGRYNDDLLNPQVDVEEYIGRIEGRIRRIRLTRAKYQSKELAKEAVAELAEA